MHGPLDGADGARQGGNSPGLTGTWWRLIEIMEPTRTWRPAPGVRATLQLTEDGRLNGKACNHYSGAVRVEGDRLLVSDLAGTLMACPEPVAAVEEAFTRLLSGPRLRWSLEDAELRLDGADGHALRFTATLPT